MVGDNIMKRRFKVYASTSDKGYLYITKHGLGPGTLPRGVRVNDSRELDDYLTAIWVDRPLTSKELDYYDIYPETGIDDLLARYGINETWRSLNASTKIIASAWVSPSGRKYGKQTRRFPGKYLFTKRELKQMVDNGDARYIGGNLDHTINYDVIGISWNDTNGHRTGILIEDRDTGELLVGNEGSASVARY